MLLHEDGIEIMATVDAEPAFRRDSGHCMIYRIVRSAVHPSRLRAATVGQPGVQAATPSSRIVCLTRMV
jgi:hypothetical protein